MAVDWTPPVPYEHVAPPIVFAHRGASHERPQNTLVAFDRARELGAALELDVHASADGTVVVLHDEDVACTTDGTGPVKAHSDAALAALDAGAKFVDPQGRRSWAGRGVRIPQLAEVLARYPGVPINIDVKQAQPCIVGAVVGVVRAAHAARVAAGHPGPLPLVLTSFHGEVKARLQAARPPCALGLAKPEVVAVLLHSYLRWPLAALGLHWPLPAHLRGRALQLPDAVAGMPVFTAPVRRAIAGAHMPVHVWEVDDPAEAQRLFAAGVDGVFSNDPARLLGFPPG